MESLLSSEHFAAADYGESTDQLVLPANTTDRQREKQEAKRKRLSAPADEVKEEVKTLSKKKQKRMDQIQKRKEREARQSEYFDIIKKNELNAQAQQLITSSRSLNQTLSIKQTLSLLLKKEKAGIQLSEEEMNLLYVQKPVLSMEVDDDRELWNPQSMIDPTEKQTTTSVEPVVAQEVQRSHTTSTVANDETATAVSFSDLFATPSAAPSSKATSIATASLVGPSKDQKKNKKNKKNKKSDESEEVVNTVAVDDEIVSTTVTAPAPVAAMPNEPAVLNPQKKSKSKSLDKNVGSNLLSQLMNLKASKQAAPAPEETVKVVNEDDAMEIDESDEDQKSTVATPCADPIIGYQVKEIEEPVTAMGCIQSTGNVDDHKASTGTESSRPRNAIFVSRPADVVSSRINLPVCRMEQEIVEAINSNDVVILCGETGSGKSTQVPQFLYEAGYATNGSMIAVAQPRRVAVTSTADRVNYEMGGENKRVNVRADGRLVGYQIRYDRSTVGADTRIKFLTDGILLREVTGDILLRQYNAIILDEAHERNVNTDILLGMLSRAIPLRKQIALEEQTRWESLSEQDRRQYALPLQPLKLIIMSATIRVADFQSTALFGSIPPVLHVEARQFPVVPHFAKRTELKHYLKETHRKVCQVHRKLPPGGVLVFLTGKREILMMCAKLRKSLSIRQKSLSQHETDQQTDASEGENDTEEGNNDVDDEEEEVENEMENEFGMLGDGDQAEIDSDREHDDIDDDFDSDSDDDGDDNNNGSGGEDDGLDDHLNQEMHQSSSLVKTESLSQNNISALDEGDALRKQMLAQILNLTDDTSAKDETVDKHAHNTQMTPASADDHDVSKQTDPLATENQPQERDDTPMLKPLIRPLYAMMPAHLQERVFAPVPAGYRLIVVATNVAETSITIPGITYVVDCGRCKEKVISTENGAGIAKYEINWISKASADQRQGRAGRTGPGHCYRLYSANFYHEHMRSFLPPEITSTPLEDVVLQMKALGIREIESFPFPTAPPRSALLNALGLLTNLGAIAKSSALSNATSNNHSNTAMTAMKRMVEKIQEHRQRDGDEDNAAHVCDVGDLSDLGKWMAKFPLHPRYAKMLIIAAQNGSQQVSQIQLIGHVLTLVATMAERSVFMFDEAKSAKLELKDEAGTSDDEDNDDEEEDDEERVAFRKQQRQRRSGQLMHHPHGDAMARLRATGAFFFTVRQEVERILQARKEAKKSIRNDGESDDDESSSEGDVQEEEKEGEEKKRLGKKLWQLASNGESVKQFCHDNFLHLPSLQRVMDLRWQLQTISESLLPTLMSSAASQELELDPPVSPPSAEQDQLLRQILISGYCDSIARKAPLGMVKEGSRRRRCTAYFSCNPHVTEPIYLHPQSNLFQSDPTASLPEFLCYDSLLRNQRGDTLYMTNASVISWTWLSSIARDCPLLTWGAPLASPSPSFDTTKDCVMCHVVPKYGTQQWTLPAVKRPMSECISLGSSVTPDSKQSLLPLGHRSEDEVYRWFARFLLEGSIGLQLRDVLSADKFSEPTLAFTQNKVHPKISPLLRELVRKKVSSKQSLLQILREQPQFLLEEIQTLLKPQFRKDFRLKWSQLLNKNK